MQDPSYILYYCSESFVKSPRAILIGKDWQPIPIENKNIYKYVEKNGFIRLELNCFDENGAKDVSKVNESDNQIGFVAKNPSSFVCVYGERGEGIKIGSEQMFTISGMIVICDNGAKRALSPGKYRIEVTSGELHLIICDANKVFLIGDQNEYSIKELSNQLKGTNQSGTDQSMGSLGEHSLLNDANMSSDSGVVEMSTSAQRGPKRLAYDQRNDGFQTNSDIMVSFDNQGWQQLMAPPYSSGQGQPSYAPRLQFLIYYANHTRKAMGALFGPILAQTECKEILNIHMNLLVIDSTSIGKSNRSRIECVLYNEDIIEMKTEMNNLMSGPVFNLSALNSAKLNIYGEDSDGIMVSNGSVVRFRGRPYKMVGNQLVEIPAENASNEYFCAQTDDQSYHLIVSDEKLICFTPNDCRQ